MSKKWLRMLRTGFSAFIPDCSTMAKPPCRCTRSWPGVRPAMSTPSKMMQPAETRAGGLDSPVSAKPRVDLPDPDSPTSPTKSPCSRAKETAFTAGTGSAPFGS